MTHYLVKRNIPFEIKLLIGILIISTILVTFTTIKVKTAEEYNAVEAQTVPIPFTKTETVYKNVTINNFTIVYEDFNYTLIKDGDIETSINNDKRYATQKYELYFNKDITFCVEYDYTFHYDGTSLTDKNEKLCFVNESVKEFELEQIYTGSKNELMFKVNITKVPQTEVEVYKDDIISVPQNITTTYYENKTSYVNVTKTRYVNQTLISWLFK